MRVRNKSRDRIRSRGRATKRVKERKRAREKEIEKERARKREGARPTYTLKPHDPDPIPNTRGQCSRESEVIPGSRHLALFNERAVMCCLQPRLMPDSVCWLGCHKTCYGKQGAWRAVEA